MVGLGTAHSFTLYWRRFNTLGAVSGLPAGLAVSILFVVIGPSVLGANAWFPLDNPGIVSIPIGFLGAWLGTLLSREPTAEARYTELLVRANTGLGAEV
jgi:cation/acetate symporter